jgi:hypothetical protein
LWTSMLCALVVAGAIRVDGAHLMGVDQLIPHMS